MADAQIEAVIIGLKKTFIYNKAIPRILRGVQSAIKFVWWLLGNVSTHFIMMSFFVLAGIINFYIATQIDAPFGGIQAVAGTSHQNQLLVSAGMIVYGSLIAYFKRIELLTVGGLFVVYYSTAIGFHTLTGNLAIQSAIAAIGYALFALALLRASAEEALRKQSESKFAETVAEIQALKEQISGGRTLEVSQ